jgi:hypothetical protein
MDGYRRSPDRPLHLERIRFSSARFRELQGLKVAVAGASIAVVVGGYLIAGPAPTAGGTLVALGVAGILMMPGVLWLTRYYASTFGRQTSGASVDRQTRITFLTLWWVTVCFSPFAPTAFTVAVVSWWIAIRDWPWRAYYLVTSMPVLIGFMANAFDPRVDAGVRVALTYFLLGVSLVPVGLLDHRLLVKLMEEARTPDVAAASARGDV